MKDSLLNLQRGIGLRDFSSEAEEKRSRYHWPTHQAIRRAVQYTVGPVCLCAGSREDEGAGPTGSWSNRKQSEDQSSPAHRGRTSQTGCAPPITRRNWGVTPQHWGIVGKSLHLWDKQFLPLLFPSASYCKPCGAERKREHFCMHLDNIAPLSQCPCGPVPVCVSNKKKNRRLNDAL